MDASSWLDEVKAALATAGVPRSCRRRLLGELRDHVDDLFCEERNHAMSTEALQDNLIQSRLGTPDQIARSTKANLPRSAFAVRHPIVTYLLTPLPLLILFWVAYLAGLIGLVSVLKPLAQEPWSATAAPFTDWQNPMPKNGAPSRLGGTT